MSVIFRTVLIALGQISARYRNFRRIPVQTGNVAFCEIRGSVISAAVLGPAIVGAFPIQTTTLRTIQTRKSHLPEVGESFVEQCHIICPMSTLFAVKCAKIFSSVIVARFAKQIAPLGKVGVAKALLFVATVFCLLPCSAARVFPALRNWTRQ